MRTSAIAGIVCIIVITALFGCGKSDIDNGPDTMTVSISSPTGTTTTTYTEQFGNNLGPALWSSVTTSTFVGLGSMGTGCGTLIFIHVGGTAAQAYPIDYSNAPCTAIDYTDNDCQTYISYPLLSGTITLTSVGDLGQKITGSFDALISGLTNTADTRRIYGSFSVTRDH